MAVHDRVIYLFIALAIVAAIVAVIAIAQSSASAKTAETAEKNSTVAVGAITGIKGDPGEKGLKGEPGDKGIKGEPGDTGSAASVIQFVQQDEVTVPPGTMTNLTPLAQTGNMSWINTVGSVRKFHINGYFRNNQSVPSTANCSISLQRPNQIGNNRNLFNYDFAVTIPITSTAIPSSDKTHFFIEITSIIARDSVGTFVRSTCVLNCSPSNTSHVTCDKSVYITFDESSLDAHLLRFYILDVYTAVTYNVFVENLT